jgi:glycosyltransferase involved in cell wall biosynthesis
VKVVYFIDHLRPDGSQRVLTQLVKGLSERGHQQAVVCLNDSWDREVIEGLTTADCEVRVVGKGALVSGVGLVSTWRWLSKNKFDVAVTLLFVSDVAGRILSRVAKIPHLVTYIQARNSNYTPMQRWLVRNTIGLADQIVVCSRMLKDYVVGVEGASEDRVRIIPHGVQVKSIPQTRNGNGIRAELNLPGDVLLVGSLGRLTYQKGYDVLLDALAQIDNGDIHLLIAGTGQEYQNLQSQADRLGIQPRVHLPGFRRDVSQLLAELDVYVQPSRFEGMPNAVLEAMAAGCPVIASAVDGNCELIDNGETGWLVPAGDSRALADCISAVASNPGEAKHKGAAAKLKVGRIYNLDQMVARWEKVLYG